MFARIAIVIAIAFGFIALPSPVATVAIEILNEDQEWDAFHADAFAEYADEFTALFNAVETKWAKNGRLMVRAGDSGSFKFARKA